MYIYMCVYIEQLNAKDADISSKIQTSIRMKVKPVSDVINSDVAQLTIMLHLSS